MDNPKDFHFWSPHFQIVFYYYDETYSSMKIEIITISKLKTRFLEYFSRAENGERFIVIRRG